MAQIPAFPDSFPQFDELYVVSDLHMGGGSPGSQIFASGQELAALIDYVRDQQAERVAFLINGDLVDFLAEPNAEPFAPDDAERRLTRIVNDPAFKLTWDALSGFIRKEKRHLVITLGNHDLELALPWVRAHLVNLLAGDDAAARGRVTLAFDGTGFRCRVGSADVLCLHGNEVDDWNITDHESIRRIARDMQHGQPVQPWIPNAGTHLVIDAMNDIKRNYPFVDLLKPEMEAVLPTLLAVAPEKRDRIRAALPVLWQLTRDKIRRAVGLLGAAEEGERPSDPTEGRQPNRTRPPTNGDALLAQAELRFQAGVEPISMVGSDSYGAYLGVPGAIVDFFGGEDRSEVLRQALEQLWKDRSFEWAQTDDTFNRLNETVGANIDFILAGHTHLRRALPRRNGGGGYFNSGTWARLIRLEPRVLADRDEFSRIYAALKAGTMEALDNYPGLVLRQRTVVAIRAEAGATRGELLQWTPPADLQKVDPGAGFTVSKR